MERERERERSLRPHKANVIHGIDLIIAIPAAIAVMRFIQCSCCTRPDWSKWVDVV